MAKTGGVPGYIEDFCHVRSEIQASQTCAYLNWVILAVCGIMNSQPFLI